MTTLPATDSQPLVCAPAGALHRIRVLAAKEMRDALRNRWFLLYAAAFAALSLALASLALTGTGRTGIAGFGRTAASVINVALLIVPLMSLTIGAGALAGEHERGTLALLLAQPLRRVDVLAGKFLGLALALLGALLLGFGATALTLWLRGASSNVVPYVAIFAFTALLAWAMLAVGLLISALAGRTALAQGIAVFAWLGFVFLGDLGLMGSAVVLRLTADELLAAALCNPLHVFKMSAVSTIHRSLDLLGPSGLYATRTFGAALPWLLSGILVAWIVLPASAAALVFTRRSAR